MSVKINVFNCKQSPTNIESQEMIAAKELQKRFNSYMDSMKDVSGQINIFVSVKLYGYSRGDLDLVVIANLSNCHITKKTLRCKIKNTETNTTDVINADDLSVDSFICTIELKDFAFGKIWKEGTHYWGHYQRTNIDEDLSEQSDEQKYSLVNYLNDTFNISPFVTNTLYFQSIDSAALAQLKKNELDNALASGFSFEDFIRTILLQSNIVYFNRGYHLACFNTSNNEVAKLIAAWTTKRVPKGITRTKFEAITQSSLNKDNFNIEIGSKFSIISGRAGTGKTVKLLQLAYKLANEQNKKRCLLLTYNNALVSDIRRLIDFTDVPSGSGDRTVDVQTRDSFFLKLMYNCGILSKGLIHQDEFDDTFNEGLQKLYDYIVEELSDKDIHVLKELIDKRIDWDYIMVDEAQDWKPIHRDILFKIYGSDKIIVADGIDQFISSYDKLNWGETLPDDRISQPDLMQMERRQKANLVRFINAYSNKLNLGWKVTPNPEIPGGVVKIYPVYSSDTHIELKMNCEQNDCEDYDILILFPPCDMNEDKSGFRLAEDFKKHGISIFDGSKKDLRKLYPSIDQSRVYQYDSCRGLEGWCVVCTKFDELINYKMNDRNIRVKTNGLDEKKAKRDFVYLWSLMPLTRAIDTLIITLNDPNSEIGHVLHELADAMPNYVEWHC